MKRLASASFLLALSWPAVGQDVGDQVAFKGGVQSFIINAAPSGGTGTVVYDSGESALPPQAWDTLLFQGVSPDPGVVFEAARKDASGAWSSWISATIKRHPNGRFWGRIQFALGVGSLRLRALDQGILKSHVIEVYGLDVFNSFLQPLGGGAPSGRAPASAVPGPAVHGRAEWAAKPPKEDYISHVPERMTLHHTAGPQTSSLAESEQELRFIQDFHQNGRGWSDIAYHFLIDAAGNVFEGRPENVVGAHTLGNNTGNVGIALLGTHHPPKNDPATDPELAAVVAVGRYLLQRYGIPAAALKGHRDYKGTECPGDLVYPLLPELRRRIAPPAPVESLAPKIKALEVPAPDFSR